ncbi:potassium ABC transporter ATPase [Undibacterium sp. TJN19]
MELLYIGGILLFAACTFALIQGCGHLGGGL